MTNNITKIEDNLEQLSRLIAQHKSLLLENGEVRAAGFLFNAEVEVERALVVLLKKKLGVT